MYAHTDANGKSVTLNIQMNPDVHATNLVMGRLWLTNFYTVFREAANGDRDVLISRTYLASPDTWRMNDTTRWLVICFGIFFFLLSVAALLAILQPIKSLPR